MNITFVCVIRIIINNLLFFKLQKLAELSNKIQRIEIMMSILEAKVEIASVYLLLLLSSLSKCEIPSYL